MEIGLMAHSRRGNCYMEIKEYGKAIEDFSIVLFHEPKCVEALLNRGICHLRLQECNR